MKTFVLKQAIFNCLLLLSCNHIDAQINLIGDPSAEDTISASNYFGQESLKQWKNLDSSKALACSFFYLHYESSTVTVLPNNQWFYQHPHSGGGVLEFTFKWYTIPPFKRSVARTKLKSKLIAGKTYCAKMYVNAEDKYTDYFTDGIAMYFDNGQLDTIVAQDSSGVYPFVNPQVSNPTGNILSDTMNWVAVSGTFVANGTETFLTIGNFKTDSATMRAINPATYDSISPVNASGLVVDDISLIEVNIANWLQDVHTVLGDSVYIGLPKYEVEDALWYDINMVYIGKGSGIKVKPTQATTQYIQAIDMCSAMRYDTMTVWAWPLNLTPHPFPNGEGDVWVWPNPTSRLFTIESDVKLTNATIKIMNVMGEVVMNKSGLNGKHIEVDISELANGVYFVEVSNLGITRRMKLVKN